MRARGSRVALLAGLGAAAVAVVILLQWREIQVQYHLVRMRRDPSHNFVEREVQGTTSESESEALMRLIRENGFGASVLGRYFQFHEPLDEDWWGSESDIEGAIVTTGLVTTCFRWQGEESSGRGLKQRFAGPSHPGSPVDQPARLQRLLGLFPAASGQTVRFPLYPALEFQIQTLLNGRVSGPRWSDGPALAADRVVEVQRIIGLAGEKVPVGVVYLRRVRAPAPR